MFCLYLVYLTVKQGGLNMIKVIKKDGTKEDFNVQKVVVAVNKSPIGR